MVCDGFFVNYHHFYVNTIMSTLETGQPKYRTVKTAFGIYWGLIKNQATKYSLCSFLQRILSQVNNVYLFVQHAQLTHIMSFSGFEFLAFLMQAHQTRNQTGTNDRQQRR